MTRVIATTDYGERSKRMNEQAPATRKASLGGRARQFCTELNGRYSRACAYAAVKLTARAAHASENTEGSDHRLGGPARAATVAAVFALPTSLALLLTADVAHAQIDPNKGINEVFSTIGKIGMGLGVVVGIGLLCAKRIMGMLGAFLAGGLVWVICENPEGTIGAAAEWVVNAF